jgi:hypothetical protein
MAIEPISKRRYNRLRAIVDKAQEYWKANATYSRGGWSSMSKELSAHPDYARCTNEMRGLVEQYELLRDLPERISAYIGAGGFVTVWTGQPIGRARVVSSFRQNYTTVFQYYATIGGREYTGRGHGEGMLVNLRETAASKRSRDNGK